MITGDPAFAAYLVHTELPEYTLQEIRRFFEDYKILENKEVLVEDFEGVDQALAVLREALALYQGIAKKPIA